MEERISDTEDTVEEIDTLFKQNIKAKNTKHPGNQGHQ